MSRPLTKKQIADNEEWARSLEWRSAEGPRIEAWTTDDDRPDLVVRFNRPYYDFLPRVQAPEHTRWTAGPSWVERPREPQRYGSGGEVPEFGVTTKRNRSTFMLHGEVRIEKTLSRQDVNVTFGFLPPYRRTIGVKLR